MQVRLLSGAPDKLNNNIVHTIKCTKQFKEFNMTSFYEEKVGGNHVHYGSVLSLWRIPFYLFLDLVSHLA